MIKYEQCNGTTSKKIRCKRVALLGFNYCEQHIKVIIKKPELKSKLINITRVNLNE